MPFDGIGAIPMRFGAPRSIRTALLVAAILAVPSPVASFIEYAPAQPQIALAQTVRPSPSPQSGQPDPRSAVFAADFRTVFSSALAVLAEQGIPVSDRREPGLVRGLVPLVHKEGLIRTGSVKVDQNRLRELVAERFRPLVNRRGRWGGRYVLQITITSVSRAQTKVSLETLIVVTLSESHGPGGQVVPSSMRLETEFLDRLAARIPRYPLR